MVIAESDRDLFALCLTIKRKVMKKFLSMTLLLTAMFLTFSACSSDDDEKNSLSGTEWVTKYADDYLIIKFTSDSKVEGYFADSNFVMDGRLSSGTYTIDGNQVTFNNFIIKYMGSFEYRYTNATISGSAMTVTSSVPVLSK